MSHKTLRYNTNDIFYYTSIETDCREDIINNNNDDETIQRSTKKRKCNEDICPTKQSQPQQQQQYYYYNQMINDNSNNKNNSNGYTKKCSYGDCHRDVNINLSFLCNYHIKKEKKMESIKNIACSYDSYCSNKVYSNKYCRKHYDGLKNKQQPPFYNNIMPMSKYELENRCVITTCSNKRYMKNDLCRKHYKSIDFK